MLINPGIFIYVKKTVNRSSKYIFYFSDCCHSQFNLLNNMDSLEKAEFLFV
ncbi:hypothetical protein [Enterobacter sp.]|uniref:hypothetical protein n=1 Tax=Enterobacter sp. TaxID=42895 RepID=UPI0039927E70